MAENTRTYGQGAVYGSLAYDFNNPALNPEYEEHWSVQHQVESPAIEEEQAQAQTAPKTMQAIAPFSVIGLVLAAVLFVFALMAQIQLTTVSDEAVALTDKIAQLETEQTRLRIEYESAFNLTEIEEYAISELGMQKPRSDQIFYLDSATPDKAEILSPEESDGLLDRVSDFVGSMGEYLH